MPEGHEGCERDRPIDDKLDADVRIKHRLEDLDAAEYNDRMSSRLPANPLSDAVRQGLKDLRHGLLRLHKTLLDSEQVTYERIHGRVESAGQLLQLVMGDPWFAWLRPLSHLVIRIDEMLDDGQQISHEDIARVMTEVRALLTPSEEGEGFERNYYEALQRTPDVVLAHAHVKKLLAVVAV